MKKVVLIGGGTGISSLIRGIKDINGLEISAIIAVSDSGGNTEIIRKIFKIPAIGDIRQVISAFSTNETIVNDVLSYRFKESHKILKNYSLGNLIISALIDIEKDFYRGIKSINHLLDLKGEVIPITDYKDITLCAKFNDGIVIEGEKNIPNKNSKIKEIFYKNPEKIKVNEVAIDKILNADYIILGLGSLYTSLIANLIIPGVSESIIKNKNAKLIYFCNATTQPGETDNMNAYDHLMEIEKYICTNIIDIIVVDNSKIDKKVISHYNKHNQFKVEIDENLINSHPILIESSLIDTNSKHIVHSAQKIEKVFRKILNNDY
ncbi:MAG: gluconeogenesis factor YvcK family protein [Mycoplasmoidaceae bacterium]